MRLLVKIPALLLAVTAVPAGAAETITYKYDARGRVIQVIRSGTVFKQVDGNGVDVSSGAYELAIPLGSLGGGRLPLIEYLSGSTGHNLQVKFSRAESGSSVSFNLLLAPPWKPSAAPRPRPASRPTKAAARS